MLRQKSRPYLFSNSIPPLVAAAGIKMVEMMSSTNELQDKLHNNTEYFMEKMSKVGFDIKPTASAICAVMLYDAKLAQDFAAKLLDEGIYVIGFSFPVVPKGLARIRVQLSAAHETEHLDKAITAFEKVGKELGVIK
jgi:glycine C-acetyltransferase